MNVAGWVCVGIAAWFAVSCGIGLLIGAAIIRANAEDALFRAWEAEAMASDRAAVRRPGAEDATVSRTAVESRSTVVRLDIGSASADDGGGAGRAHTA